jgi:hypothetical protein
MNAVDAAEEWERFCAELARASAVFRRPGMPRDERIRAEGLRHLARMIRAGVELHLEMADPAHPVLTPMIERWMLYEGVTSDARYHHALFDGSASHRIRGSRGTAPLLEIGVYTGKQAIHETSHLLASLTEAELRVEPDGRFEVELGPERRPGNWLRTDARARYLMIREYSSDWSATRAGSFEIQREGPMLPRAPLDVETARAGLAGAAGFVARACAFWSGLSDYWAGVAPNRFLHTPRGGGERLRRIDELGREVEAPDWARVQDGVTDSRTEVAPPAGHQFSCGWFRLAEDDALVARFVPVAASYWAIELASYWYEPLCFRTGRSIVNHRTAVHEPDGSVRVVIAGRDPGVPNWLDTDGHREGMMIFRLSRSGSTPPAIETERVGVDSLRRSGPA